ncbi:hypothetical protein GYMLUDRAFT_50876 [Collybiopsis luxurians FD-317 M1]|uniref:N-acetyltransferase domain-containing protein n=1 Tax=Collybiopsis luxurians FD-317 M1 TaxID=944289 RepID=A0A0D0C893_9AGAR|nr:hypothetical protein GYMLUDRAFT_50876 [Collybiopsis luxurians FD-317 M1]
MMVTKSETASTPASSNTPNLSVNGSIAPFTVTKGNETFTIREARREDLQAIGWAAAEAFINDAMAYYLSGTTKPMEITDKAALRELHDLYYFLFKAGILGGGRAVVAVPVAPDKAEGSDSVPMIAAAACWYPPRKRVKTLNALRGGIVRCIWNWGLQGFDRMANEYTLITHGVFERAFEKRRMVAPESAGEKKRRKGNSERILKESDSWYLQAMFCSKRFEGRGLMSTLMREGYAYANRATPGIPITLDATSERARDRYAHLGYELMEPVTIIGAGKATPQGINPANKEEKRKRKGELTGVPYWCMVNWDSSRYLEGSKEK